MAWSSLVEGGEGSYLPNCQTILDIAFYTPPLFFVSLKAQQLTTWADTSLHLP